MTAAVVLRCVTLGIVLVGFAPSLSAQELMLPEARQGYFLGGGLALMANTNNSTKEGEIGPLTGGNLNVRFGEMVTDWLGFGFHVSGGLSSDERWDTQYAGAMLDVQVVPFDHWSIRIGIGAGGLRANDNVEERDSALGTGGAYYLAGISYDHFPFYNDGRSGGISFAPTLHVIHLPGDAFDAFIVTLGVETLWWSGLAKNKLELPEDEAYRAKP